MRQSVTKESSHAIHRSIQAQLDASYVTLLLIEVIAEGLVMYLSPQVVRDLFCQCDSVTGGGSRVAFSYIPAGRDGRPDAGRRTGLMLWNLKAQGEPWLWSVRPDELGGFLADTGWTDAPDLAGTTDKHGVEYFAVARK